MQIDIGEIKDCCNTQTFSRGMKINREKKVYAVRIEYQTKSEVCLRGNVQGSNGNIYRTSILYDIQEAQIYDYQCECPAIDQYYGMCKHCVALALEFAPQKHSSVNKGFAGLKDNKKNGVFREKIPTDSKLADIIFRYSMDSKTRYIQPELTGNIELVPKLRRSYQGFSIEFKIGAEHKYVLKDIVRFLDNMESRDKVTYGKKLSFIHEYSAFTDYSRRIIRFLKQIVEGYKYYKSGHYSSYLPVIREMNLNESQMAQLFDISVGQSIQMEDPYTDDTELKVIDQNPDLQVKLEQTEDNSKAFWLYFPEIESFSNNEQLFVRKDEIVYRCTPEFSDHMREICGMARVGQPNTFFINEADMVSFCAAILPVLQKYTTVSKTEQIADYIPQQAVIKIYLDYEKGKLTCLLTADYGEESYNLIKPLDTASAFRDVQKESAAAYTANRYFDRKENEDYFQLDDWEEDRVYMLLTEGIEQLRIQGEVFISDAFKKLTVLPPAKVKVGVSLKGGLLDLTLDIDRLPMNELEGILANYQKRKKYYRLKNGEFIALEENSLSVVSELVDSMGMKQRDIGKGSFQVPKFRAMYIDQLLKSEESIEVNRNTAFKSAIRDMKAVEDSDYVIPESLKSTLRHYQKIGYRWLRTLEHMGFGGILADDMGLGKSLQVIAYLVGRKQELTSFCNLIVCPASLVYNWESEIDKFAPDLKKFVAAGSVEERKEGLLRAADYDVIITSYDLLKRDLEEYKKIDFYAMIIDEAQNIKNHTTQAAKAVKEIPSRVRFALTGTPVENRLSELWSIFDFLMPGLLYSYQKFRTEFEIPIVQSQDEITIKRLQGMIKPFILRRLKREVLKEIPDKNEDVVYSKLEGEQKRIYQANVQKMLDSLHKKSAQEFQSDKLQILAEITRLRQICCAPSLVYHNYEGEAVKIDTCMELIQNAMEAGHKTLIFSQFTSIFALLEKRLKKNKISYYRLDGSTPKLKRTDMVKAFNENDTPVFLISLKAGGTGLNLTAASIVIHFDPWWNAAAQNQATDRAHRIGQTKTVNVYKLIAKDTIEEKIMKLQESKKELSNQIITEGGFSVSSLSKEDLAELLKS